MIYLDNNASTPIRPEVKRVFTDSLDVDYANASNRSHSAGNLAATRLEEARRRIAESLGRDHREVFFTSGATEAITIAVMGFSLINSERNQIAVNATEHGAVISAARQAIKLNQGQIAWMPVDHSGLLVESGINECVTPSTSLCAVMAVNNESGVIQHHQSVMARCAETKTPVLVDITQAIGKVHLNENWLNAEAVCLSGHKIGAPKGIGLLILSRDSQMNFFKMFPGGGQQREIRGGTQNIPGALALAEAIDLSIRGVDDFISRSSMTVSKFLEQLDAAELKYEIAGEGAERVSNTAMIRIVDVDGDLLLSRTPGVALSLASACHFGDDEPSHVLTSMGYSRKEASEFFRLSTGYQNSIDDGAHAGALVAEAACKILEESRP